MGLFIGLFSGQEVVAPGSPCGQGLTAEAAREMGLLPGTPVAASIIDAHAGGLGNVLLPAFLCIWAYLCVCLCVSEPVRLRVCLCVCVPVCLPLFVCLALCICACLFATVCVFVSVYLCLSVWLCLCVCLNQFVNVAARLL